MNDQSVSTDPTDRLKSLDRQSPWHVVGELLIQLEKISATNVAGKPWAYVIADQLGVSHAHVRSAARAAAMLERLSARPDFKPSHYYNVSLPNLDIVARMLSIDESVAIASLQKLSLAKGAGRIGRPELTKIYNDLLAENENKANAVPQRMGRKRENEFIKRCKAFVDWSHVEESSRKFEFVSPDFIFSTGDRTIAASCKHLSSHALARLYRPFLLEISFDSSFFDELWVFLPHTAGDFIKRLQTDVQRLKLNNVGIIIVIDDDEEHDVHSHNIHETFDLATISKHVVLNPMVSGSPNPDRRDLRKSRSSITAIA
jgi:hypothetical protein